MSFRGSSALAQAGALTFPASRPPSALRPGAKHGAWLALPLALAACTATPPPRLATPALVTAPPAVVPVLPSKPVDWRDRPYTPGSWDYADGAANYGAQGAPLLTMACDRARRVVTLSVPGMATSLTLRTSYGERAWPAQPVAGGRSAISFAAVDPALDQIAFSRGRFSLSANGIAELDVPAWAEPSRVIEDCRG